jgi:CheY-like chemotaxis protein
MALQNSSSTASLRPPTVLYVEDNDINVLLVQQILELRPQWALEVANSGAQALQLIPQVKPDLLLLDMHLGDMSGLDLIELLNKQEAVQGIVKVALSADAMPGRIEAAKARGFSDYLTKPLDVMALLACLDGHLSEGVQNVPE